MKTQAIAGSKKIRRSIEAGRVACDTPSNTPTVPLHWQKEKKQVELPRALISAFISSAGPVYISTHSLCFGRYTYRIIFISYVYHAFRQSQHSHHEWMHEWIHFTKICTFPSNCPSKWCHKHWPLTNFRIWWYHRHDPPDEEDNGVDWP